MVNVVAVSSQQCCVTSRPFSSGVKRDIPGPPRLSSEIPGLMHACGHDFIAVATPPGDSRWVWSPSLGTHTEKLISSWSREKLNGAPQLSWIPGSLTMVVILAPLLCCIARRRVGTAVISPCLIHEWSRGEFQVSFQRQGEPCHGPSLKGRLCDCHGWPIHHSSSRPSAATVLPSSGIPWSGRDGLRGKRHGCQHYPLTPLPLQKGPIRLPLCLEDRESQEPAQTLQKGRSPGLQVARFRCIRSLEGPATNNTA